MITVKRIDHIVLRTENLEAMLQFYSGLLGCAVERSLAPETGLTQLRAGDSLIDIVTVDSKLGQAGGGPPGPHGNNMDHFCLQIAKTDDAGLKQWLESRGIEAGRFEIRYGAQGFGPSVYLHDPDGNTVELRPELENLPD